MKHIVKSVTLTTWQPIAAKGDNNFGDKRSLGQYSSLEDSDHCVYFSYIPLLPIRVVTWSKACCLARIKTLVLWARITLEAWKCLCIYSHVCRQRPNVYRLKKLMKGAKARKRAEES
jgi:hypothetical protein